MGPAEIRRILDVTDALHIHRESVKVPLATHGAGSVRIAGDRIEIVAPAERDFEAWLGTLAERIAALDLSTIRMAE